MSWQRHTQADLVGVPIFAVDATGRVQIWNAAMERLTGQSAADVTDMLWHDVIGQRAGTRWLLARAQPGLRQGELVLRAPRGGLRLGIIAWPVTLGGPTVAGELCWVERVVFDASDPKPDQAWVEIDTTTARFGRILRVSGSADPELVGARCYEAICDLAAPCATCPARTPANRNARAPILIVDREANLFVVRASLLSKRTARIGHERVGGEVLASLVHARIDALAQSHELSLREREVLHGLASGTSVDEIARALVITARTVKFHKANVLHKLRLDSRLELARLVFETTTSTTGVRASAPRVSVGARARPRRTSRSSS